jgi:hypothetical protein
MLKRRQLIDVTQSGAVSILEFSSRKVLQESAAIFESLGPSTEERAAINPAQALQCRSAGGSSVNGHII